MFLAGRAAGLPAYGSHDMLRVSRWMEAKNGS